ncbi:MAG TPA: hypothetical protein ENO08_07775 [Candidatus Eisenbacteria bacterium]|uniref:Uncharacterized protein n=1 Tax=Eiseniibacteriota bacterium TaxID=2212470 RepID=A0A7V2F538_UNCEI|nr:hypothetical protein [Candidatus Eisenbacteria bacterium]
MRLLLLTVVLAAMLATPAAAYENGYIGLFTDEARSSWCIESAEIPFTFDVWVYCLPSDNGTRGVEFSISDLAPSYFLTGTATGPWVSITMGDIFTGISYSLYLCREDWFLLDVYSFIATGPGQTAIWLEGHEDTGLIRMANCLPGYPVEDARAYASVFVNYPPGSPECAGTATEESSWGAIKDMYSR